MVTSWPCDTGTAVGFDPTEDLMQIIATAVNNAPTADAVDIVDKATNCALNHAHDETGDDTDHCEYVRSAREHAGLGDWTMCKQALDHAGGQVATVALPAATTWPCNQGTAPTGTYDADQLLWQVIQIANTSAPALEWKTIILRATECALTHEPESGPGYLNATAHCKWLAKAKTYASAMNWSYCIGALEHLGGGFDPGVEIEAHSVAEWEEVIGRMDVRTARALSSTAKSLMALIRDIVRYEIARASGKIPGNPHDPDL